jgi:CheY-like chemotaxis protein
VVADGLEALAFLHRTGKYAQEATPDLILLDLNMPRKTGGEVLAEIKEDPGLKHIPVVVLTTSTRDEDVMICYQHHANCFIAKPADLKQFMAVVQAIDEFWFNIVKLPTP